MKEYETPMLIEAGEFGEVTGLLQSSGNDRLIFSKN
ncbi:keywimysin-related RiPP [Amycolatopsis orientalis]|nr:keywimysin-related RiPP [Amycolatopsis orientalis]